MRTIEVSDEVYDKLQRAASERGESVEAYLSSVVEGDGLQKFFTPEFIAEQDRIYEEMQSPGGALTTKEVWASLEAHKANRRVARA